MKRHEVNVKKLSGCEYFCNVLKLKLFFPCHHSSFSSQGFMFAPSATMSCSPVAPSTSTHPPGRPSQRPSMKTVCPNIRRGLGLIRYLQNGLSDYQPSTAKEYLHIFFRLMRVVLFQVKCGKCGNGLGHEFVNDGPAKGVSRFWIFSSSLKFIPKGTISGCLD